MPESVEADPFLQIVHISDLHLVDPNFAYSDRLLQIEGFAKSLPKLRDMWTDGTAPHDPFAPAEFKEFIQNVTVRDPVWRDLETWLVDTGDRTTFGDDDSLRLGSDLFRDWSTAAEASGELVLHGNHDAWPEMLPLAAMENDVRSHRALLRRNWYQQNWAEVPLRCAIPHTRNQVLLFGLNSVLHERLRNTLALGEIKEDRYWEHVPAPADGVQLQKLAAHAGSGRSLRIVAVHHPVHYPNRPSARMHMDNDSAIARELRGAAPSGVAPLAHIVLSGHTHALFPEHGTLPPQVRNCAHPDLGPDQCQLVVGSLMQHDPLGTRGPWPHQCQVLRLYAPVRHKNLVVMERLLAARIGGTGPYRFVRTDAGQDAEEIVAAY